MACLALVAAAAAGLASGAPARHSARVAAAPDRPAVTAAPTITPLAFSPSATGPTDLIRSREWPLTALHVPQAWKWSKGSRVTVAVLDTGVDGRHPDLVGRVIQGPDFTGGERRPGGVYWGRHGTAMASIIAGHGHGPGRALGVMGVAPQAKILSIRVTWEIDDPVRSDRTRATQNRDAVAKGIRYAVDHGAQIINMSLGGGKMADSGNPAEEEAVRYALDKGALLIASAGNDGAGLNRMNFPAAYPGVTAVGAVDKTLRPAKFTNRHGYVSVAAPGVDIVSADAGRSYVQGTGTSPSAAIIAGIAALVRSRFPALTPEQTKQALEQGTVQRPPGGRNTKIGAGVTDAVKALFAGYRIAKTARPAEPAGAVPQPSAAPTQTDGSGVPLIGIVLGVALAAAGGLILAWRRRARGYDVEDDPPAPVSVEKAVRVPVGAALSGGRAMSDAPPPPVPKTSKEEWPVDLGNDVTPSPVPTSNQPAGHQSYGENGYGDDPLGPGSVVPLIEITPLADQSWEIVLRDRRDAPYPPAETPFPTDPPLGAPPPTDLPYTYLPTADAVSPVTETSDPAPEAAASSADGPVDPFDYYWAFEPLDDDPLDGRRGQ